MHIVDWVTNLGGKFAPVDAGVIKTLQIQLTEEFNNKLHTYTKKMEKNNTIKFDLKNMEAEKKKAEFDGNQDVASDVAYRMRELEKEVEQPSIIEKACVFFDKPLVKLMLLLTFGLVSAFIAKRILGKKKEEIDTDLDGNQEAQMMGNFPHPYPYQPPYAYQPYGSQQRRY